MFLRYQHSNYAGDFRSRLNALNLDQYFNRYPLLVKYDWLRPAFHVPVPAECFHNDSDLPVQWPPSSQPKLHWADAYDGQWFISENDVGTDEWFVHPLLRRGSSRVEFFDRAISNHDDFSWEEIHHSEGRNFVPAFDYFYEWQIFRFADVVNWMRGDHPHFWQPGAYANLAKYVTEVSAIDFDRAAHAPGWSTRAQAFTWLAHFIAYCKSFQRYELFLFGKQTAADSPVNAQLEEERICARKLGATELMSWLGITPQIFEQALRDQILTLAQDWRGREYHDTAAMRPLWRALQEQIRAAVDWLCLVNDDTSVVYLERLRYDYPGQREWVQLEDVYNHPRWKAAQTVSSRIKATAKRYPTKGHDFTRNFSPNPIELINLASKIDAFGSYLDALGRFLEESQFTSGDDPFRARNRTSWYRVMAVMAEIVFKDVVSDRMVGKEKFAYQAIARILANRGKEWWDFVSAQGGIKSEVTLESVSCRVLESESREDLVLNFSLAAHYARNITVHQSKLDAHFLYAHWADEIFEALVLFVPWALMQLQPREQTE